MRKALTLYIVLSSGISYIIGLVWLGVTNPIDTQMDWENQPVSLFILKYGPSIAGIITIASIKGGKSVLSLLSQGLKWRTPWMVVIVSVFVPLLALITSSALWGYEFLTQTLSLSLLYSFFQTLAYKLFLGGGFGEEFGWRGFMQPTLEKKYSWIKSSLVVAFFWILWHLPAAFLGGDLGNPFIFILTVIGFSIILAWVYNHSKGSVLWAAIFHATVNASSTAFENQVGNQLDEVEFSINLTYAVLIIIVSIILIIAYNKPYTHEPTTWNT